MEHLRRVFQTQGTHGYRHGVMKNVFLGKRRARGWVHTVRHWEEGVERMLERTHPDPQEARERRTTPHPPTPHHVEITGLDVE